VPDSEPEIAHWSLSVGRAKRSAADPIEPIT